MHRLPPGAILRWLPRGLGVVAGLLVVYLGVISFYVGGPENLFDWEYMVVGAAPDGTEGDIGGGWIVDGAQGSLFLVDDPADPLLDFPGRMHVTVEEVSPGERYLDDLMLDWVRYRRRRIQSWLPLHLLGID